MWRILGFQQFIWKENCKIIFFEELQNDQTFGCVKNRFVDAHIFLIF